MVKWTRANCFECDGFGQVPDYGNGEDFYGAKECGLCKGSGSVWVSERGRLAEYPGGRFLGRVAS